MTARTRRYPVVIHCTEEVPIWNSSIKEGKVTFMAVSTTTPEKDIMPVATIDRISFRSIFYLHSFSGTSIFCILKISNT